MTKFKFMKVTSFAVIAVICLSLTVSAQQRGQRGGQQRGGFQGFSRGGTRTASPMSLISRSEVQKELECGEETIKAIKALLDNIRPDYSSLGSRDRNRDRDLTDEQREAQREERTKKFAEIRAESEKKSKDAEAYLFELILKPVQVKRLLEIVFQQLGIEVLLKADTQKELNFSAEQTAMVKAAKETRDKKQEDLTKQGRELFGSLRGGNRGDNTNRDDIRAAFAKIREQGEKLRDEREKNTKTFETVLNTVLSAAQKTKFETMKGKPFELASRRRGGQRGGQRGGRPGGDRGQGGGGRPDRPDRPDRP